MTETEAKSIHTLIRELQSIIKNSQEQWGLNFPKGQGDKGDKSDKSQTNIAIANGIYILIFNGHIYDILLKKLFTFVVNSCTYIWASKLK